MLLTITQFCLPSSARRTQISDLNSTNCDCIKFSLDQEKISQIQRGYTICGYCSRLHQQGHGVLRTCLNIILEFSFDSSHSLCFADSSFKSPPNILFSLLEFSFLTLGFASASELAQSSSLNYNPSCTQMSSSLNDTFQLSLFSKICTALKIPFVQILY